MTDKSPARSVPHSVPPELTIALHRARVKPGMELEATRWMDMLNERLVEAEATLDREMMALEIVFRSTEVDGDYLTWVSIHGDGESVESSTHPLDVDHLAFDRNVRERGWTVGEVQLLLAPAAIRAAIASWAADAKP